MEYTEVWYVEIARGRIVDMNSATIEAGDYREIKRLEKPQHYKEGKVVFIGKPLASFFQFYGYKIERLREFHSELSDLLNIIDNKTSI